MDEAGVTYWDLMKDANVVHQNAYITAEATVAEILKYSDYSIRGQKIIVSGYGKCGRDCQCAWISRREGDSACEKC